jgi:hypothetical protein
MELNMNPIVRGGLLAVLCGGVSIGVVALDAATGLEDVCASPDFDIQAGSFTLGNLQVYRGPFDFEGAHLVGCIVNGGDEAVTEMELVYDNIQVRGGGGGSGSLALAELRPGERGVFVSSAFRQDPEQLERFGIEGIRLREIKIPQGWERKEKPDGSASMEMAYQTHRLDPRPEMPYPLVDLPDGALTQTCAAIEAAAGAGALSFSELQVLEFPGGKSRVVGCLTNAGSESVAAGFGNQVQVRYTGGGSGASAQGWGSIRLPGAVEPGTSSVFVSGFDIPPSVEKVELTLP